MSLMNNDIPIISDMKMLVLSFQNSNNRPTHEWRKGISVDAFGL